MTPDDYERQAAEAEARADKLRALAELDYEQARWLRQQAAKLRRIEGGLNLDARAAKLSKMDAQAGERPGRGRPPSTNRAHPIHSLPIPVKKLADELGVARTTLQDWIGGHRAIPRKQAEKLAKKHGVPVSSWPRLRD